MGEGGCKSRNLNGPKAAAGAMGHEEGNQALLSQTKVSHTGWAKATLIDVLLGELGAATFHYSRHLWANLRPGWGRKRACLWAFRLRALLLFICLAGNRGITSSGLVF